MKIRLLKGAAVVMAVAGLAMGLRGLQQKAHESVACGGQPHAWGRWEQDTNYYEHGLTGQRVYPYQRRRCERCGWWEEER